MTSYVLAPTYSAAASLLVVTEVDVTRETELLRKIN